MKINDKLIQEGFTESILEFYHSRTKQGDTVIKSAFLFGKKEDNHIVKVELVTGRVVCYEMNLANIRQKKINLFLSR